MGRIQYILGDHCQIHEYHDLSNVYRCETQPHKWRTRKKREFVTHILYYPKRRANNACALGGRLNTPKSIVRRFHRNIIACSCCCCGRCNSTRRWWPTGSHPTESLVEQDCVSSAYWLCVSWAESSCQTESRREKPTKNQQLTLNFHVSVVCTCTFCWYGRTHGPWAVKSTGRPT